MTGWYSELRDIGRGLFYVVFAIVTLPILLIGGCHVKGKLWDDPRYAEHYFQGLVPVERVLETKRWHDYAEDGYGCTYAIATLHAGAPASPPARTTDEPSLDWQAEWGLDWKATPASPEYFEPEERRPSANGKVQECEDEWSAETRTRIRAALSEPGSFYDNGDLEVLYIYSPMYRIAARIRSGD